MNDKETASVSIRSDDDFFPPAKDKEIDGSLCFDDFGGDRYTFPRACTDLRGNSYAGRVFGDLVLMGDPFADIPELIKRYKRMEGKFPIEVGLIKEELASAVGRLVLDEFMTPAVSQVSSLRHAVVKVENEILKQDISAVTSDFLKIRGERDKLLFNLNRYREGALAGRTAHRLSLSVANDMHNMVERLIDTHPYYAGPVRIKNPKRVCVYALEDAFGCMRNLAKATAGQILSIDGVGQTTLERVVETFREDGMPCIAEFGEFAQINHCHWSSVSCISSVPIYRWGIPSVLAGEGAYLERSVSGLSYLNVVRESAPPAPEKQESKVTPPEESDSLS